MGNVVVDVMKNKVRRFPFSFASSLCVVCCEEVKRGDADVVRFGLGFRSASSLVPLEV